MKVTLENITTPNKTVGENKGFHATLLIDGTTVGEAKNEGGLSVTVYRPNGLVAENLLNMAEVYFQSLQGRIMTLSDAINNAFLEHEVISSQGVEPAYKTDWAHDTIVVFDNYWQNFRCVHLKYTLDELAAMEHGEKTLRKVIQQFIFPDLGPGDLLLSPRLPPKLLAEIGLYQYKTIKNPFTNSHKWSRGPRRH